MIDDLSRQDGYVLATGGGAVLDPDSRRFLSSRGFVVYLYCSPEQQYERTQHDRNRPLLQTDDPLLRLQSLLEERDPLYRQTADIVVTTEKRGAQTVAREIVSRFESR